MLPVDFALQGLRGRLAQQGADIRETGMGYPAQQYLAKMAAQNQGLHAGTVDPDDPNVIGSLAGLKRALGAA